MKRDALADRGARARALLQAFVAERGVTAIQMATPSKGREITALRREFFRLAVGSGIGSTTIARLVGMTEGAVCYHMRQAGIPPTQRKADA